MKKETILIVKSELIWWVVTLVLLLIMLLPIYLSNSKYPFWIQNAIFVVVFVTFTRYIFLLKHTVLRFAQWAKVVVLIACIPLAFNLVQWLNAFHQFTDEIGVQALFANLSEKDQSRMVEYTKAEMTFFGVGSILATIVMPFRMLISFWRTFNKGTA